MNEKAQLASNWNNWNLQDSFSGIWSLKQTTASSTFWGCTSNFRKNGYESDFSHYISSLWCQNRVFIQAYHSSSHQWAQQLTDGAHLHLKKHGHWSTTNSTPPPTGTNETRQEHPTDRCRTLYKRVCFANSDPSMVNQRIRFTVDATVVEKGQRLQQFRHSETGGFWLVTILTFEHSHGPFFVIND